MGKAGKGSRGKRSDASRQRKPAEVSGPASGIGVGEAVKKPETTAAQVVQATTVKPEARSFDVAGYLKSMAWVYPVALIGIMLLMLYLRAGPSYDQVFMDWDGGYVNFAGDDAVYHMRLVHETVNHFPDRIFYDPFTYYPYGSTTHFGPLLSLLIAGVALVVGLGNPSLALVDTIGAYTPAILGMLCAIPTYFIGKKLFGRNVAILAAFTLALLPGQFMGRSMLGFTDHHILEVLLSLTTVALMMYALDRAQKSGLSLTKLKNRDKGALIALSFGILAGVSMGLGMLAWLGILMMSGFMLLIYFVAQAAVDHIKGRDLEYLPILAVPLYLIPAVMVLPYALTNLRLEQVNYSIAHPLFLILALAGVGFVYGLSRLHRKAKAEAWTFPVLLLGLGAAAMIVLFFGAPQVFSLIQGGLMTFFPSGGMAAVAEAQPPGVDHLWGYFFWTFPIALIGLVLFAFRALKDNKPAEWLFLVWNLMMLMATFSQDRFSYYFAINAALLTAYVIQSLFRTFDWSKFVENWRRQVKKAADAGEFVSRNTGQVVKFAALGALCLVLVTWPATSLSTGAYNSADLGKNPTGFFLTGMTELYSDGSLSLNYEWYETLMWMRNNTPDPQAAGFSYDSGSYVKPVDGSRYNYPANAYGVMAWWDYGHLITYVAQRIPNANPFQAGVTSNNNTEGSAPFFTATEEATGYANLQNLGSRYVIVERDDANGFVRNPMLVWIQDTVGMETTQDFQMSPSSGPASLVVNSPRYYQTMANRLYHEDCTNMSHFRLVYESPGDYLVYVRWIDVDAQRYLRDDETPYLGWANYTEAYQKYMAARSPVPLDPEGRYLVYDSQPPAKLVKVFEVVDGATIKGQTAPGTGVSAALNLSIGDRTFEYVLTGVADQSGNYELTVPYATEAMNGTGYSSNVKPLGKYTLTVGNTTSQVDVPEDAVQTGRTITVS